MDLVEGLLCESCRALLDLARVLLVTLKGVADLVAVLFPRGITDGCLYRKLLKIHLFLGKSK